MKHLFRICVLLCIGYGAMAQAVDAKVFENLKFRNAGPAGMSGRITTIDVELANQDHILVGSASGGVWESQDGGIDWKPIFDEAPSLAIGAVRFNQRNPLEIWVGTGEGNPRNTCNAGRGVFRTLDGGKTWTCMGLEETRSIHRIIIDPYDPAIVYVAALGSPWGPNRERGLYKTRNSGKSWEQVLYVNDSTGICDLVMDPRNHLKLIAATWQYGRTPWNFESGGPGSGIHMSFDGGTTWKTLSSDDGLPSGQLGRTGLAIAANKPDVVYALIEAKENGLYRSDDGGLQWKLVSTRDIGNRPFYYSEIYVDPSNENRIWNLWSYVSKSEDGGRTFQTILDYDKGVHPDHHAFWISPTHPNFMIEGNDGGLNISRDGGRNWRFVTNLPVGQFYHVNLDQDYPYHVYGGMQDNGSWVGPGYVLKAGGIRNADWREVLFGDGFDVLPYRADNRYGWAMYQGGGLSYYDYVTGLQEYQKPVSPDSIPYRFNWNAALAQNPFHDCGIYYGSQFVLKSTDCGRSWERISPDLTTNDTTKQKQDKSGGLTVDVTGAENYTTILAIAPSPVNEDVIWVGTDDGNLQLTRDGGASWTKLNSQMPGLPDHGWIPQVEPSARNPGEAFVVVNNYRQNDWAPYLYHTTDFGATFTRLVSTGDVGSFVLSVLQDPVEPRLLFLGADDGLYVSFNGGGSWQKWSQKSLPPVPVSDMKIHPVEGDLVLATFGRAIWILDDLRPLREIAHSSGRILSDTLVVFPAPEAILAAYRSVDGIRFTADAEYLGDNRPGGARLTVWNKPKAEDPPANKKATDLTGGKKSRGSATQSSVADTIMAHPADSTTSKKKAEKFQCTVLNADGDTVRTFSVKPKEGINRITWDLRHNGIRNATHHEPDKDADPPAGRVVLPGTYQVIVGYRGHQDSSMIVVRKDPRLPVSDEMLVRQDALWREVEHLVLATNEAFAQLRDAKKTVKLLESAIVNAPDSTQENVKKRGKEMVTQIDSLMALYMIPEDAKGIPEEDSRLANRVDEMQYYLKAAPGAIGGNSRLAEERLHHELQKGLDAVNAFVDGPWKSYVEEMRNIEFNLFKELKNVEIRSN